VGLIAIHQVLLCWVTHLEMSVTMLVFGKVAAQSMTKEQRQLAKAIQELCLP